jgi:hypothetical protein
MRIDGRENCIRLAEGLDRAPSFHQPYNVDPLQGRSIEGLINLSR